MDGNKKGYWRVEKNADLTSDGYTMADPRTHAARLPRMRRVDEQGEGHKDFEHKINKKKSAQTVPQKTIPGHNMKLDI